MHVISRSITCSLIFLAAARAPLEGQTKDTSAAIRIENLRSVEPNSAGGVEVRLAWRNLSLTKTVKYAIFEVVPFNAVDDSVASEIGNKIFARLRDVGPVLPGQWSALRAKDGSDKFDISSWDNVWYNSTIVRVELRRVRIDYMDGSHITLQGKGLKNVLHCTPGSEWTDEAPSGFCDRVAHVK